MKNWICFWCGKTFDSKHGQFCPRCCRFQNGKATQKNICTRNDYLDYCYPDLPIHPHNKEK